MSLASLAADLAPTGALRASINLGHPVLAQGTPDAPSGITVDLAREIGNGFVAASLRRAGQSETLAAPPVQPQFCPPPGGRRAEL